MQQLIRSELHCCIRQAGLLAKRAVATQMHAAEAKYGSSDSNSTAAAPVVAQTAAPTTAAVRSGACLCCNNDAHKNVVQNSPASTTYC